MFVYQSVKEYRTVITKNIKNKLLYKCKIYYFLTEQTADVTNITY